VRAVRERYGVQVGGGLGPLAGRVVRISHLGIEMFHVFGLLGALSVTSGGSVDTVADRAAHAYGEVDGWGSSR
jgi:aspartate aminotransferase-like enzyme